MSMRLSMRLFNIFSTYALQLRGERAAAFIDKLDQALGLSSLNDDYRKNFTSTLHKLCLEGTQEDFLAEILSWALDPDNRRVYRLNGNDESGKSTIGQTFAERCSMRQILGASFFCSRDFKDRSSLDLIFPTLIYDLAFHSPAFRDALIPITRESPNLGRESLSSQLDKLLVRPLKTSGISAIIVVDAIDECKDEMSTSSILFVLGRRINEISSVKFLITGRPEPRIHSGFGLPLLHLHTDVFLFHEVKRSSVDHDIQLYLRAEFCKLVECRTEIEFPEPWPDDNKIRFLVRKADGLFIFAIFICKFISLRPGTPHKLLQKMLEMEFRSDYEGQLATDALYTQTLSETCKESNPVLDVPQMLSVMMLSVILGTIVVALNPLTLMALAMLLRMDADEISSLLSLLYSLIRVPDLPLFPPLPSCLSQTLSRLPARKRSMQRLAIPHRCRRASRTPCNQLSTADEG